MCVQYCTLSFTQLPEENVKNVIYNHKTSTVKESYKESSFNLGNYFDLCVLITF